MLRKTFISIIAVTVLLFIITYIPAYNAPRPGETWTEPVTGMEFLWVPGGCFQMGQTQYEKEYLIRDAGEETYEKYYDEETPRHKVCVDGFWIGKYEVTNSQFRLFRSSHNSKDYKGNSLNSDTQPVVYVSWNDAKDYAEWLSRKTDQSFRLPTEAEWEYAARGGTTTIRYWDESPDNVCKYENLPDRTAKRKWDWENYNDCDDGYAVTAPVGSFKPNRFGLYDMMGNVCEWCEDVFDSNGYARHSKNNPKITSGSGSRVLRGGSWSSGRRCVRAAWRMGFRPNIKQHFLGFRLVFPLQD